MNPRQNLRPVTVVCVAVALVAGMSSDLLAETPKIAMGVPKCVPRNGNSVVTATVSPETGWSSVRTYFRKVGTKDFYWLEMRNEGAGAYWAVLPKPEESTIAVEMQIAVLDAEGKETRGPLQKASISSPCQVAFTPAQTERASNLVVGETAADQKGGGVFGFKCDGIISRIDARGALTADDYCRKSALAMAAADRAGKGLVLPLILAGSVGAGAGYAAVKNDEEFDCSSCRPPL